MGNVDCARHNKHSPLAMTRFAAVLNTAYIIAGFALFVTGEAPVVTSGVDFIGNKFAKAWAGWKFCGCLYMALVNFGVDLRYASALVMVPYIAFDYYAIQDTAHWTPLCWSFIALEAITLVSALAGSLKPGGVINALYLCAGVALFATGEAPVIAPGVDFLGDKFAMAWAGWKFSGCLYFALVNLGVDLNLSLFVAMLPYCAFDVFAVLDTTHWTSLAGSFVVLDGFAGVQALMAYTAGATDKAKKK